MTTTFAVSTSLVAAGPGVSSQLFGSLLIGLREGLETAIVVTILIDGAQFLSIVIKMTRELGWAEGP